MEKFRNGSVVNYKNRDDYKLRDEMDDLIRHLTPRQNRFGDQKLMLLWKFIANAYSMFRVEDSLNKTQSFIENSIHRSNNIGEFASILT